MDTSKNTPAANLQSQEKFSRNDHKSSSIGLLGTENSSYGTFVENEGSVAFDGSSFESTDMNRSPKYGTTSGLAFINVSYEVPRSFSCIPWVKKNSKTILKPAR